MNFTKNLNFTKTNSTKFISKIVKNLTNKEQTIPNYNFNLSKNDMGKQTLFFDFQSTTPLDPRVLDAMLPYLTVRFGNPHSKSHEYGWEAEKAVENAREVK
jgi:selenocysteine lyase/cysteine desulfurase